MLFTKWVCVCACVCVCVWAHREREREGEGEREVYLIYIILQLTESLTPEVDVPLLQIISLYSILSFSQIFKVFHVYKS